MLSKYEEQVIKWLHRCYFYVEEVPVIWDSKLKRISINYQLSTWVKWWFSNFIVLLLWCSCVYTLLTHFYSHREGLHLLHICILTTGFCNFTVSLACARGITALRSKMYTSAINNYIQLELSVYKSKLPMLLTTTLIKYIYFIVFMFCKVVPGKEEGKSSNEPTRSPLFN